jgi:hypothetical protein
MPKRTPEEMREYMRQYRGRKRVVETPVAIETPVIADSMSAIRRERTGDRLTNPYTDGMPDWGDLIQGVSQKQRDIWLERINTHPRGG